MKQIIKFDPTNLKGLHFFIEHLNYPVAIATYNDWQETQVSYLVKHNQTNHYGTEDICRWCINHKIKYQILYPLKKKSILQNPRKYYEFLRLKRKIKYSL